MSVTWKQLCFHVPAEKLAKAETLLDFSHALSVTVEDAGDQPIYEPKLYTTPVWKQNIVTALFNNDEDVLPLIDSLQSSLQIPLDAFVVTELENQDWIRSWMDTFKPIKFGNNLWICPSWHTPPQPDAINLFLDPGLAFGSGTHATTALCLEWLDNANLKDGDILDFGCGSGILALAAIKLGAKSATGIDIDPQAIEASEANAIKNDINPEYLTWTLADDFKQEKKFDIVVANILAKPLLELASLISTLVKPGSNLILSGILLEQADDVCECYLKYFDLRPTTTKDGWVRIDGIRRND